MEPDTNPYRALRTALNVISRPPTEVETQALRTQFIKWFGAKSITHNVFPGQYARGLERKHQAVVHMNSHYVTLKVDGISCFLYHPRMGTSTAFAITRDQTIRALDGLTFEYGRRQGPVLLEGELVWRRRMHTRGDLAEFNRLRRWTMHSYDETAEHSVQLEVEAERYSLETHDFCFVACDCLIASVCLLKANLQARLAAAKVLILGALPNYLNPRHGLRPPVVCTGKSEKLLVVYKPHQFAKNFRMFRRDVPQALVGMPVDGFILTPINLGYTPGNNPSLFKVKPAALSTVDFLVRLIQPGHYACFASNARREMELWPHHELIYEGAELKSGTIAECRFRGVTCLLVRVREDKTYPNSIRTVEATFAELKSPISYSEVEQWLRQEPPSIY